MIASSHPLRRTMLDRAGSSSKGTRSSLLKIRARSAPSTSVLRSRSISSVILGARLGSTGSSLLRSQGPILRSSRLIAPGASSTRYMSSSPMIPSVVEHNTDTMPNALAISPEQLEHMGPISATDDALTPISTFLDPIVDPLSSILLNLPHPLGYGTTIILLTILVRSIFTLPISLWQRKRAEKAKLLVEPEMREINKRLALQVADDCKRRGVPYKGYVLELRKQLAKAQSALHKKHGTNPMITTWSPLLVHIPIFVTLSMTIRKTLELPSSPVFGESFFWLDKLGEVDPYGILPIVGMGVAFGNAEIVGRKGKSKASAQDDAESDEKVPATQAGVSVISPRISEGHGAGPTSISTPSTSTGPQPGPSGLFASRPSSSASASSASPSRKPSPRRLSTSTASLADISSAITRKPAPAPSPRRPVPVKPVSKASPSSSRGEKSSISRNRSGVPNQIKNKDDVLVDVTSSGNNVEPDNKPAFSPARQQDLRRNFMAGILRFSALGFGMIASQMPAGVTLYWVTSMTFSLVQNLTLSLLPQRLHEKNAAKALFESAQKQ